MKNIRLNGLLFVCICLLCGCNREDDLTPGSFEEDRLLALLDMNQPLVKKMKEGCGVNVLTRFSDTLDFKFGMYDKGSWGNWNQIEIVHLPEDESGFALGQLDQMVLGYFTDTTFIRRCFPRKLLVAAEVFGNILAPDPFVREPDNQEVGAWSAIGGKYSYLFAFDKSIMDILGPAQLESLRNVKLYCFISWLYNYNNLYSELPEEFYNLVDGLHREKLADIAKGDEELSPVEGGKYRVEWYIGRGMALTKNSPAQASGGDFEDRLRITSNDQLAFPGRERDFRNFLNVVFCESEQNIRTYYLTSDLFKRRMRIVLDVLKSYGIDFTKAKPVLKEFYN